MKLKYLKALLARMYQRRDPRPEAYNFGSEVQAAADPSSKERDPAKARRAILLRLDKGVSPRGNLVGSLAHGYTGEALHTALDQLLEENLVVSRAPRNEFEGRVDRHWLELTPAGREHVSHLAA